MKIHAFLQDGFETVEALAVVDVTRRAGLTVETVSLMDGLSVTSAQKIEVKVDRLYKDCDFDTTDLFFLPGGPGTKNYETHPEFLALIKKAYAQDKWIAAICAAPSILGHLGILEGKRATCFPGFEKDLYGAAVTDEKVVMDGKVITGKGMGASIDLGLAIVRALLGEEKATEVGRNSQYL